MSQLQYLWALLGITNVKYNWVATWQNRWRKLQCALDNGWAWMLGFYTGMKGDIFHSWFRDSATSANDNSCTQGRSIVLRQSLPWAPIASLLLKRLVLSRHEQFFKLCPYLTFYLAPGINHPQLLLLLFATFGFQHWRSEFQLKSTTVWHTHSKLITS